MNFHHIKGKLKDAYVIFPGSLPKILFAQNVPVSVTCLHEPITRFEREDTYMTRLYGQ